MFHEQISSKLNNAFYELIEENLDENIQAYVNNSDSKYWNRMVIGCTKIVFISISRNESVRELGLNSSFYDGYCICFDI